MAYNLNDSKFFGRSDNRPPVSRETVDSWKNEAYKDFIKSRGTMSPEERAHQERQTIVVPQSVPSEYPWLPNKEYTTTLPNPFATSTKEEVGRRELAPVFQGSYAANQGGSLSSAKPATLPKPSEERVKDSNGRPRVVHFGPRGGRYIKDGKGNFKRI